ncbi:MAG: hypothetical protein ACRCTR_08970 [Actinomycetota bacterium]
MNKDRRRRIEEICGQLDTIREAIDELVDEEREAFDNMPESLQESERGQASEQAAGSLDSARDAVDEALGSLEEAAE